MGMMLAACTNNPPQDEVDEASVAPALSVEPAGKPGYTDYLLTFRGFTARHISDIQSYIDTFSCYDSHALMAQGDSTEFSYRSCMSSAGLSENLTRMLTRLELTGEVHFSDRTFFISMAGENRPLGCVFRNTTIAAPGWVCGEAVPGLIRQALGEAGPMKNLALAKTMAASRARVELVRSVSTEVEGLASSSETSEGDTWKDINKIITKGRLKNSTIEGSIIGPDGTTYVLVGIRATQKEDAAN